MTDLTENELAQFTDLMAQFEAEARAEGAEDVALFERLKQHFADLWEEAGW